MIHVGLIGVGSIARRHLAGYRQYERLGSLAAADPNLANIESADYPFAAKTADYRDLLADDRIQAVDICVPHYLHARIAIDALEAGKHVIVEKPIGMNAAEGEAMAAAAKRSGKRLMVAMNQCFMPHHVAAKAILERGELGRVFMTVFHVMGDEFRTMNNPDHWKGSLDKAGGGAMIDTGYHIVYTMIHFFGMPTAVSAATKRLLVEPANKGDDNTGVLVEFGDRMLGVVAISYTVSSEPWQEHRHVYGTEGSLHLSDELECPIRLVKGGEDVPVPVDMGSEHPHATSVAACLHHYLDCLIDGQKPIVTHELALAATRTLDAIYLAGREQRRVEL